MVKFNVFKKQKGTKTCFSVLAKGGKPEVKSKCTSKANAVRQVRKLGMMSRLAKKKGIY